MVRGAFRGVPLSAVFFFLLLSGCSPNGEEGNKPAAWAGLEVADSLVASGVGTGLVPGTVFLVARNGRVVLEKAYGAAQAMVWDGGDTAPEPDGTYLPHPRPMAPARPMTTETFFDLASVTKVMATTMAIMILVEDGELRLDDPVGLYLPSFSGPGKEAITVRHLLTHTSGLAQWQPLYYQASNPSEAIAVISEMPLSWSVGEGRHYSDLGFMVLGELVRSISGQRLDGFLEARLFSPLGLERTGFNPSQGPFAATSHGNPYEFRMVHDSTFGYRYWGDPNAWTGWRHHTLVGEVNDGNAFHAFGGVAGHAGLFASAADLNRLLQLLLKEGGSVEGRQRIFSSRTVRAFLSPALPGQALGWRIPPWAPPGSFFHTGFTGTFILGVPSRNLAVVLLTNRQNFGVDEETRYPDLTAFQRSVSEALLAGPPGAVTP